jgi:outer membrane protein OmpA-like peptidoglycan-associated protein
MPVADPGGPWQLRAGFWLRGFVQSDYLIAGDRHSAVWGAFQFDATLGRNVEVWVMVGGASHRSERADAGAPLLQSLGDLSLGARLHGRLGRAWHGAIHPYLRMPGGTELGPSLGATSPGLDGLISLDLREVNRVVPLRLHLQVGYLQDRSLGLLPQEGCGGEGVSDAVRDRCVHERVVRAAALGLRAPRLRLGLGADLPIPAGRHLQLSPMLEYNIEVAIGDGDGVIRDFVHEVLGERDGRVSQWLAAGLRLQSSIGLTLDGGLLAALVHPGFAMGPPLPQVSGYVALSFAADMARRPAPPPPPGPPSPGPPIAAAPAEPKPVRVRGVVRDGNGKPLAGATVRFPSHRVNALLTDEDGSYESPPLPAGPAGEVRVEVSHPGHETVHGKIVVAAGQVAQVDTSLPETPPPPASLRVDVVDDRGQPLPASVSLRREGQRVDAPPDIGGGFVAQAEPGTWTIHVESEEHLTREQAVVLGRGSKQQVTLVLPRRPERSSVRLAEDQIALRGSVNFAPGTADLLPASTRLLDEVADLLLTHPEVKRVRIEGHTDNVGRPEANQRLSEERAIAVRSYLLRQGVAPERLSAEGRGSSQPLAPNLTPASRAKNRRVVFKIVER